MIKKGIIILICVSIVVIRAIFPEFNFDWISFALVIFSGILIFVTDLKPFSDRITKVKFGEVELELAEQLKELSERTEEKIEETTELTKSSAISGLPNLQGVPFKSEMLAEKLDSPDAALLMIAIEIEKQIRTIYEASSLKEERIPISIPKLAQLLESHKILDSGIADIIADFWKIRNKIAHGHPSELRESQMYELIETGYKILRLLNPEMSSSKDDNDKTKISLMG